MLLLPLNKIRTITPVFVPNFAFEPCSLHACGNFRSRQGPFPLFCALFRFFQYLRPLVGVQALLLSATQATATQKATQATATQATATQATATQAAAAAAAAAAKPTFVPMVAHVTSRVDAIITHRIWVLPRC